MAHAPFWPGDFRLREMRWERLMGVSGGNKKAHRKGEPSSACAAQVLV